MTNLKKQLVRLGEDQPQLRIHLRPILDAVTKTQFLTGRASSLLKTSGHQRLVSALKDKIEEIERNAFEGALADVQVWGPEKTERADQMYDADIAVVFDGAGYNFFSYRSDYPQLVDKNIRKLEAIAERHGYHMEVLTNWAVGFYKG